MSNIAHSVAHYDAYLCLSPLGQVSQMLLDQGSVGNHLGVDSHYVGVRDPPTEDAEKRA